MSLYSNGSVECKNKQIDRYFGYGTVGYLSRQLHPAGEDRPSD